MPPIRMSGGFCRKTLMPGNVRQFLAQTCDELIHMRPSACAASRRMKMRPAVAADGGSSAPDRRHVVIDVRVSVDDPRRPPIDAPRMPSKEMSWPASVTRRSGRCPRWERTLRESLEELDRRRRARPATGPASPPMPHHPVEAPVVDLQHAVEKTLRGAQSRPCFRLRMHVHERLHSIGVRVSDTKPETSIATLIVTANSCSNRPRMPLMNSTGMNTAASDSVMEMIVKPISREPSQRRLQWLLAHLHVPRRCSPASRSHRPPRTHRQVSAISDKLSKL